MLIQGRSGRNYKVLKLSVDQRFPQNDLLGMPTVR